jgi:hypothetical protein
MAPDGESLPSNEVPVVIAGTIGGCMAAPAAPTGLTAAVSGALVTLTWSSGGGCPAASYLLHAGTSSGAANIVTASVAGTTLSAVAPVGVYYGRVFAVNAYGASSASNEVVVAVGAVAGEWSVRRSGSEIQIFHGSGTSFPQFAVLHTESGYFRMNYGPGAGWGTSIVLLPSFWSGGQYFQGAPLSAGWSIVGADLQIDFAATLSGLQISGSVRLSPPASQTLSATVNVGVSGTVPLDIRPGEAFKPLMLSSMRISPTLWDTASAFVEGAMYSLPVEGWIVQPAVTGRSFGLLGGTSAWKTNAPTVEILLDQPRPITGWVTRSQDTNDDNVGFWAATPTVLSSWQYTATVRR